MIIEMLAAAWVQATACAPPPNADQLWADEAIRFVFVGEIHGTAEAPAAFAELVCSRSAVKPVVVALEMPDAMQPDLDAWFASDGGRKARATLLAHDYWGVGHADGRSSAAFLGLLERLHALKAAGRDITVRGYQPSERRPGGFDQSYYEIDMARLLVDAAASRPDASVLVLGGRAHAAKTPSPRHGFLFAAGHLNPRHVRSVRVAQQGGSAWGCFGETRADCGAGEFEAAETSAPGVVLERVGDGAFDGLIALGPWTPSPPALAE